MMTDRSIEDCLMQGAVAAIGHELRARKLSVREMVDWYLARIERFNREGPALNAVPTLNPHALDAASRADDELARGNDRGPLHGIPVLLKDNILTGDGMPASAGAAALADFVPRHAATLVRRLRQAGVSCLARPT
jgi:amidase